MADQKPLGLGKPTVSIGDQLKQAEAGGGSFQQVGAPVQAVGIPEHGGEGQPPLPIGQPVFIDPKGLTPLERQTLGLAGWKDGMPIPANFAEHVQAARDRVKKDATHIPSMPPPAAADLPPLEMPETVEIEQLPEHERVRLQEVLAEVGQQAEAMEQQRQAGGSPTLSPGVRAAATGQIDKIVDIEDDREQTREQRVQEVQGQQAPASGGESPTKDSGTGASEDDERCPHCDWDLSILDAIEITEEDKITFLQATLGNIPWQKSYNLLNDQMSITVRQLQPEEVDACFQQVGFENQDGRLIDRMDFWEQLNRYRMVLQLADVRTGKHVEPFPDSLKEWEGKPEGEDPTTLPLVLKQVYERIIRTESINRILAQTVGRFNREVARLEANVENADFWPAIKPQI